MFARHLKDGEAAEIRRKHQPMRRATEHGWTYYCRNCHESWRTATGRTATVLSPDDEGCTTLRLLTLACVFHRRREQAEQGTLL